MTIDHDVDLGARTTLGVGGRARHWVEVRDGASIPEAIAWAEVHGVPWTIIGGGSNLVVSDAGYPGLAIHLANASIAAQSGGGDLRRVRVGAGADWDGFVAWCCARGWVGLERLSGIPGTAGATPIQNVGAYGQEVADVLTAVRAWDTRTRAWVELAPDACAFAYRSSRFNQDDCGRFVIGEVEFTLRSGEPASLLAARAETLATRRAKGMVVEAGDPESRNAGSFFKNPLVAPDRLPPIAAAAGAPPPQFDAGQGKVKIPAAWLIEHAGFDKGFHLPGSHVALSRKHVLAIVNRGGGTAREVADLAQHVRAVVEARFGIRLQQEPVTLG